MRIRQKAVCVLLSMFVIQCGVSGFECLVEDLQNYTESISGCNDMPVLRINVTKWSRPPKDLIEQTKNIHTIDVSGQSMQSIDNKGFCEWPHLTFIDAKSNNISSLPSNVLSGCRLLNTLSLTGNQISEIYDDSFHGLSMLIDLDLSHNQIESLSANVFKPLTSLKRLFLNSNKIDAINVDHFINNQKLQTLQLSFNQITVIQLGSFWKLNQLVSLDMSNNPPLSAIDLSGMQQLHDVNVDGDALLQLTVPTYVKRISANNNKITRVTIEPNGALEKLSLRNNSFQSIDQLSHAIQLNELDISQNNISEIDFSYLMSTQIRQLIVLENPISKFDVHALTNISTLKLIEITTTNLDNQTLNQLISETKRSKITLRDPNRSPEQKIVVTMMPPVRPVPMNEVTTARSVTTARPENNPAQKSSTTPMSISGSTTSKDGIINDLLKRIQSLETQIKTSANNSEHDHPEIAESVASLRVLVICTIVAFSIFVLFQLVAFVSANYQRWTMPNVFQARSNGLLNHRRTHVNDSIDPIMEEVL